MKTALIYYSYEGATALVAENIKAALNADSFRIKTADDKKRGGLSKYLWGGKQVLMNAKPALLPFTIDVNAYDLIILGTPVWASSPSPALLSFLDKTRISGKKVAFFCCHLGSMGKVFDKLKGMLPGNNFAGEIDFRNTGAMDPAELKQKTDEWVRTLAA